MLSSSQIIEPGATATSFLLSGSIIALSSVAVPTILSTTKSTKDFTQQWKEIYTLGSAQGPLLALTATIGHLTTAYSKRSRGQDFTTSVLAAVFTLGIVPFTLLFMTTTNSKLMHGANTGLGTEDVKHLIGRWASLNAARGLLPLIGGAIGLIGLTR